MKSQILTLVLALCCFVLAGCGSPLADVAGGAAGGAAFSETFKGMQADLARREAALVDKYNALVAAGAKAEDIADVQQQLERTRQMQQGVETTKNVLGVDWSDPKAAGGAVGLIATLAWSIFSKRKLSQKYTAMKAGQAQLKLQDPAAEKKLYALVGSERAARNL